MGFWICWSNLFEFIQLVTTVHKSLTHFHLVPTGHSTGTVLTSNWTELHYSVILPRTPLCSSVLVTVSSYNSSARTPRKTPSSVVKNACLLVPYLAMDVLTIVESITSGMCLPSRCLAMGTCVTLFLPQAGLFNDAVSIWNMKRRLVSWLMNCKGFGRKHSWPNRDRNSAFVWRDLRESRKTLVRISRGVSA
jgi:hypothetical protein